MNWSAQMKSCAREEISMATKHNKMRGKREKHYKKKKIRKYCVCWNELRTIFFMSSVYSCMDKKNEEFFFCNFVFPSSFQLIWCVEKKKEYCSHRRSIGPNKKLTRVNRRRLFGLLIIGIFTWAQCVRFILIKMEKEVKQNFRLFFCSRFLQFMSLTFDLPENPHDIIYF